MGAIGLLFVGVTLFTNGLSSIVDIPKKSLSVINLLTGSLSFIIHLAYMLEGQFYTAGAGFMFAFTYLIIGICYAFDLDMKIYGVYGFFVAINTIPCAIVSYVSEGDPIFSIIWILWGILWFLGFVQYILKIDVSRFASYGAIFCGVLTTWLPGILKLLNLWPY